MSTTRPPTQPARIDRDGLRQTFLFQRNGYSPTVGVHASDPRGQIAGHAYHALSRGDGGMTVRLRRGNTLSKALSL